jgi:hypothetical protein
MKAALPHQLVIKLPFYYYIIVEMTGFREFRERLRVPFQINRKNSKEFT